jgi:SET domain-containing protein 6
LNYYGAMPTSEVLRRYGYVTPEYSRYDEIEVTRSAVVEALATATGLSPSDLTDMVSACDYLMIASRINSLKGS